MSGDSADRRALDVARDGRMSRLEDQITSLADELANLRHLPSAVSDLKDSLERFMETADKRYAAKTVERIVYAMVALTLASVWAALIGLVIAVVPGRLQL